jgi:hypothetical protein
LAGTLLCAGPREENDPAEPAVVPNQKGVELVVDGQIQDVDLEEGA